MKMNKVPKELLLSQFHSLNNTISQKEKELQDKVNPTNFVLNKDVSKIIEELKALNSQRAELEKLLNETEE